MINAQTNIVNADENHRSVEFTVPVSEVEKLFSKNAEEFRKQVSMKGFRPGKVPKTLFISRFGEEVYRETVERIIETDLREEFEKLVETWKSEGLEVAAPAKPSDVKFERGCDIFYKLSIALNTPVKIDNYKDLGVKVSPVVVSDTEINDMLEGLQKRLAKDIPVERASKDGDVVKGTYLQQIIEGKEQALPENSDFELEISDEISLKELKEALTGVSAGQEKSFTVNYPKDHPSAEFKGKAVDYKVKITEVCEMELPALNDELFQRVGSKNEEEFRAHITDDIIREKKTKTHIAALKEAFDKLLEKNHIFVTEEQIEYMAKQSVNHNLHHHHHHHPDEPEPEEIDVTKEQLDEMRPEITRAIQEDRILRYIVKQENLKPTQGQVDARVQEIANSMRMPFAEAKDIMRKNGQINKLRESLKIELAQNLLIGETMPEKVEEAATGGN